MQDKPEILKQFLENFSKVGKYQIPIGLLPEEENPEYPYEGIEVALVFYWSYKNGLLLDNVQKVVDTVLTQYSKLNHEICISIMKEAIGYELLNEYYNDKGKEFVVDYVAFTSQWKYRFYEEIDVIFRDIRSFSEIPQTKESYNTIFTLLDKRYNEYVNEIKN